MRTFEVGIYGATGHTGQMVARELERRGIRVRRIGRKTPDALDLREGEAATWRQASCDEPDALDIALAGVDAVINCAGPFLDTAPALIEAALRARVHYLDITAEQRSVRQSLATYDTEARMLGVVVVPAMAFYGGLADLLAADLARRFATVDEVLIAIALDSWRPTAGTRHTGERNTARRVIVTNGQLSPLPTVSDRKHWMFPEPFNRQEVTAVPLSKIITISRHIVAKRIESFMNVAPLVELSNASTPPPVLDETGCSNQKFVMQVQIAGDGSTASVSAAGRDIYASSAPMVAEACLRVLLKQPARGGAFAPAELFEPGDFLRALAPWMTFQGLSDQATGLPRVSQQQPAEQGIRL